MEIDIIFKIAGIGILTAVINQILKDVLDVLSKGAEKKKELLINIFRQTYKLFDC